MYADIMVSLLSIFPMFIKKSKLIKILDSDNCQYWISGALMGALHLLLYFTIDSYSDSMHRS